MELEIDTSGLADLAARVGSACDQMEDEAGDGTVLVVRLSCGPNDPRWPGEVNVAAVNRWERAVRRLERLDVPTVAVATGRCGGPALDVLLATDYRVAGGDLCLCLPRYRGRVWPGMALHRLANQLGAARARRLVLTGQDIRAERALSLGLVDEVSEDVDTAVTAAAALLGGLDVSVRRQLVLEAASTSFEDALGTHLAACDRELRRRQPAPC